jgi:hypothetical protein
VIKRIFISLYCVGVLTTSFAQKDSTKQSVYKVKSIIELPAAAAGVALSTMGFRQLEKKASLSVADVLKLDPATINSFDRSAAFLDPSDFLVFNDSCSG